MNEKVCTPDDMDGPGALSRPSDASDPGHRLERQAAGLIRVRLDGGLLACNDAALSLLGGGPRPAILNTNLSDCLVPGQRAQWQEFTSRCWSEGAASF